MDRQLIDLLARKLHDTEPTLGSVGLASVAIIVSDGDDPKTLLIRRAERGGDPWSGQIAFPGGKRQDGDISLRDTAIRETKEEVGVDLGQSARFLGYFVPFRTHTGTLDVVPSVFLLEQDVILTPNAEVSSYRWVLLSAFAHSETRTLHEPPIERGIRMPAIAIGDYTIWGLTYRIVSSLLLENN